MSKNLSSLTKAQLMEKGKEMGVALRPTMTKDIMVNAIKTHMAIAEEENKNKELKDKFDKWRQNGQEAMNKTKENKEEKQNTDPNFTLLKKEAVVINGCTRLVGIKIEHKSKKLFGVLCTESGKATRFVWDYTKFYLPVLEVKTAELKKAGSYARLFILKRLETADIKLDVVQPEKRTVDYITLPMVDGVSCNVFANGYIRGEIDGVAFAWEPGKYGNTAIALTKKHFDGSINAKIDVDRIKARLKAAGYTSLNQMFLSIRNGQQSTDDAFAPKDVV